MKSRAECSHHQSDYNRPPGQSEFYGHAHSGNCDWNASEYEPEDNSKEDHEKVRIVKLFCLVAEYSADVVNSL